MGGIKKIGHGRGKDKKKRKVRSSATHKSVAPMVSQEKPTRDILRNIIKLVSGKVRKEKAEPWAFDFGPHNRTAAQRAQDPVIPGSQGGHIFYLKDETVEIDLKELV